MFVNAVRRLASLALLMGLWSCSQPVAFHNTDITGVPYAQEFEWRSMNGAIKHLEDYRGKLVVVFFGYTQCPDVCPTTLSEMAQVMQQLGAQADSVQVLFVTLDPERDTEELLRAYVPQFDPRFEGLYPSDAAALTKTAKDFKLFFQKVPGKQPGSYTLDHTAGSYVFDRSGKVRLFLRHGQGPAPIVDDLKVLLKQGL